MKKPEESWPPGRTSTGILFFAQLMHEMLFDYAWDSYRVPALDTIHRITEGRHIIHEIRTKSLNAQILEPIVEEIIWSMTEDKILHEILGKDSLALIESIKSKRNDIEHISQLLEFLNRNCKDVYQTECEKKITELCRNLSSKSHLENIIKLYCSHLTNIGYSRSFIYHSVQEVFFRNLKLVNTRTLNKFFNLFHKDPADFKVYSIVSTDFAKCIEETYGGGFRIDILDVPQSMVNDKPAFFTPAMTKEFILMRIPNVRDKYVARLLAERLLGIVTSVGFTIPHKLNFKLDPRMYIVRGREPKGTLFSERVEPLARRIPRGRVRVSRHINKMSHQILGGSFSPSSQERIIRSLNTAALAQTSGDLENQLISLWAAIETILSEPRGKIRIKHYIDLLLPCLVNKYVRRNFEVAYFDLHSIYGRDFRRVLREEQLGKGGVEKFVTIICLQGRENIKGNLLSLCKDNPLALYRLYFLSKTFANPRLLKKFVNKHKERLGWHLHRIYRTRNMLVHSGRPLIYLETILMNLYEYYLNTIYTIIAKSETYNTTMDIDQIVYDINIEHELYMKRLNKYGKDTRVNEENIFEILNL